MLHVRFGVETKCTPIRKQTPSYRIVVSIHAGRRPAIGRTWHTSKAGPSLGSQPSRKGAQHKLFRPPVSGSTSPGMSNHRRLSGVRLQRLHVLESLAIRRFCTVHSLLILFRVSAELIAGGC